jgi:hypothetical protein
MGWWLMKQNGFFFYKSWVAAIAWWLVRIGTNYTHAH